jgi:NADH dehydrogenase FAD-containing subunit
LVTAIDGDGRSIQLQTDTVTERIPYDYLIYALGSRVDVDSVPGVRQHAYTLDASGSLAAEPLHQKLQTTAVHGGKVVVVGSGPTGIETAGEIRYLFPQVRVKIITQGEFSAFTVARVRRYLRGAVDRLGIEVIEVVSVTAVHAHELHTTQGIIPCDICIWAGGFKGLPLARQAGIQVNKRNQILVDPALCSLSHPAIYAVGDAVQPVQPVGAPMRMSLFTALVTAAHTADNLTRRLQGKRERPFGFSTYGQGIAIGRHDAVGFNTYPSDKPIGPLITGKAGLTICNFFVGLILQLLAVERKWPGFFFWPGKWRGWKGKVERMREMAVSLQV